MLSRSHRPSRASTGLPGRTFQSGSGFWNSTRTIRSSSACATLTKIAVTIPRSLRPRNCYTAQHFWPKAGHSRTQRGSPSCSWTVWLARCEKRGRARPAALLFVDFASDLIEDVDPQVARVLAAAADVDRNVVAYGERPLAGAHVEAGSSRLDHAPVDRGDQDPVRVGDRSHLEVYCDVVHGRVPGTGEFAVGAGRPALGGGGEEGLRLLGGGEQDHHLRHLRVRIIRSSWKGRRIVVPADRGVPAARIDGCLSGVQGVKAFGGELPSRGPFLLDVVVFQLVDLFLARRSGEAQGGIDLGRTEQQIRQRGLRDRRPRRGGRGRRRGR